MIQKSAPRNVGVSRLVRLTLLAALSLVATESATLAQFKWSPFGSPDKSQSDDDEAPAKPWDDRKENTPVIPEGVTREELPSGPINEKARAVDRDELAPVMAGDGSGLPYDLWRGLTAAEVGDHFISLEIPPRSPAVAGLWRRLITADAGSGTDKAFTLRRIEALERTGLSAEALAALTALDNGAQDPQVALAIARIEIGLGNKDRGCERMAAIRPAKSALSRPEQATAAVIAAYCAAAQGDMTTASLQSSLARELAIPGLLGPDLIDAVAGDVQAPLPKAARLTPLDYRIAELKGGLPADAVLASATPALLGVLARSASTPSELKLPAAEKAALLNIIEPADLAALYQQPGASDDAASLERGALYRQALAERTPLKKARFIRAFLDEERRVGPYWPALAMMARALDRFEPIPEVGWFAETAVEISLASGNFDQARRWATFASALPNPQGATNLEHWLALADIADPALANGRSANLGSVEKLAQGTHFDANMLHRLATVLDALDIAVPIPLWELSSRAPQPAGGHLPDTGVLSALADAAAKKEFGRTILLAMKTLGSDGAEGAHIIALGDSIRALKRAGLDQEARRLGLESLFTGWPRVTSF